MRRQVARGAQDRWGGSTSSTAVCTSRRETSGAAPAWSGGRLRAKRRLLRAVTPRARFRRMVQGGDRVTGRERAIQDEALTAVTSVVTTEVTTSRVAAGMPRLLPERRQVSRAKVRLAWPMGHTGTGCLSMEVPRLAITAGAGKGRKVLAARREEEVLQCSGTDPHRHMGGRVGVGGA